ncbi:ead/Ea22-like family protein [Escherichia coli]|uniref:ead/Ea22-like family protein n=1 Tax=Escherichia coli TaxID=562 RepID=UPI000BE2DBBA|nr:hypothetical protein [Escherichia coli]ELT4487820.1 hypothetical protein [Escherichia coli]PDO04526.1 hypothetical protein CJU65_24630 [Escherichia coli]
MRMNVFEMEGFLRGKCVPRDLKVNETNAEYLVRKFDALEAKCETLAAENAGIKSAIPEPRDIEDDNDNMDDVSLAEDFGFNHAIERMRRQIPETPATDAFLAEIRAEARNEGINYTASRLAAAFNHGFINKSLREVFDVTRMILSAKEDLANEPHPIDGLSGEYAEKSLEEWAEQIRKGVQS